MKRLLIVFAGVFFGIALFLASAIGLLWLFCANNVSMNVRNESKTILHNVSVQVSGSPYNTRTDEMAPGDVFSFSAETRTNFEFRIGFDAGGHHYDVPARLRLAPFGDYLMSISIDEKMRVSTTARFL